MKDGKFKNLVKEVYKKSKQGNLTGILYSAVQTYGFSELINFEEFADAIQIDLLYLKSKSTNKEIDVYEWELENYRIDEKKREIGIKLRGKQECLLIYWFLNFNKS